MEFETTLFGKTKYRMVWKIIELVNIIFLARILSIEEFGLGFFIMTLVFFITSFMKTGYPRHKDKEKEFYNTLSIVSPALGMITTFALLIFSFFVHKDIRLLLRFGSAFIFLRSLTVMPEIFYFGRKRYNKIYHSYTTSQLIMGIISVVMAINGYGHQSILIGYLCFHVFNLLFLWYKFPFKVQPALDKEMMVEMARYLRRNFDSIITASTLSYGVLLISLIYGLKQFSFLYMAMYIGFFTYENLTLFINSIVLKKFFEVRDNIEQYKFNFMRLMEYISLLTVPVNLIFIIIIDKVLGILIGAEWIFASEIFVIVLVAGLIKSIVETTRVILLTEEKYKMINRIRFVEFVTFILFSFILRTYYGLVLSLLIASVVSSILYFVISSLIMKINLVSVSKDYAYILASGILSALFAGLIKELFVINNLISLIVLFFLTIMCFIGITYIFNKSVYKRVIKFIFNLMRQ